MRPLAEREEMEARERAESLARREGLEPPTLRFEERKKRSK